MDIVRSIDACNRLTWFIYCFLATGAQVVKVIFWVMTSEAQYMLLFVPSRADIYGPEALTLAYNLSIYGWPS